MVLVPATMHLLGARNWWLPKWLDRILPELDIEGEGALPPPEYMPGRGPVPPADPMEPVRPVRPMEPVGPVGPADDPERELVAADR
jgi:hypothetical protein